MMNDNNNNNNNNDASSLGHPGKKKAPSPRMEQLHAESAALLRQEFQDDSENTAALVDFSFHQPLASSELDQHQQQSPLFRRHVEEADYDSSFRYHRHDDDAPPVREVLRVDDKDDDGARSPQSSQTKELVAMRWHAMIRKYYPILLILMIGILWPLGIYYSLPRLLSHTEASTTGGHHPLAHSPSAIARNVFAYRFPQSMQDPLQPVLLVVLHLIDDDDDDSISLPHDRGIHSHHDISSKDDHNNNYEHYYDEATNSSSSFFSSPSLTNNAYAWNASLGLQSYLHRVVVDAKADNKNNNTTTSSASDVLINVTSYYSLRRDQLALLSQPFMSPNHRTTVLQINYQMSEDHIHTNVTTNTTMTTPSHWNRKELLAVLQNGLEDYFVTSPDNILVEFTGLDYFANDLRASTRQDLKRMDLFVIPLALLLMEWTLLWPRRCTNQHQRQHQPKTAWWSLWIIPTCALLSTVATWSALTLGLMTLFPKLLQITTSTPSIMMSLSLGMGLDYSLFLLSRFLEECCDDNNDANGVDISTVPASPAAEFDDDHVSIGVRNMIQHAGRVVVVSGLTLACTFMGLLGLPLPYMRSIGVGSTIAIGSAMLQNLLVVPCLLYTPLGRWLQEYAAASSRRFVEEPDEQIAPTGYIDLSSLDTGHQTMVLFEEGTNGPAEDLRSEQDLVGQRHRRYPSHLVDRNEPDMEILPTPNSVWTWMAKNYLLHPYKSLIILLIISQIILLPMVSMARKLRSDDISFEEVVPVDSPSLLAYQRLVDDFHAPGRLAPMHLIFDYGASTTSNSTLNNRTVASQEAFDVVHRVIQQLIKIDIITTKPEQTTNHTGSIRQQQIWNPINSDEEMDWERLLNDSGEPCSSHDCLRSTSAKFSGIAVLRNIPISYYAYKAATQCGASPRRCPFDSLRCLSTIDSYMTSSDKMATYVSIELPVSPFSEEGVQWLEASRTLLRTMRQNGDLGGLEVYIDGTAAVAHDIVNGVYRSFPWVIAVTMVVVFLLLGYFFGSIVPPLRSIVSISSTLAVSYGLAVVVYQDGFFNGTEIRAIMALNPDICWLVPIMSFSIMVGLALDYDVFLVTRILEFRVDLGYQHLSSIAAALDATGGVITSAGVVMAVSFGSLLASGSPALNQWSFLLVVSVLVDTFLIRTLVVPSLIGLTGAKYSWHPRVVPTGQIRVDGFDEPVYH